MEKNFTEQESFAVITRMINSAKNNIEKYSGVYLLLWGYLVFISSLLHFLLLKYSCFSSYAEFSYLFILIGFLAIYPINTKQKAHETITTYVGKVIGYIWIAFAVSSFMIGIFVFLDQSIGKFIFSLMLLLLAMVLFTSGLAYKYRPLLVGSIICWVSSLFTFFVSFEYQILIYSVSILFAYIIPGHLIIRQKNV